MTLKKKILVATGLTLAAALVAGAAWGQMWLNRRAREGVDRQITRLSSVACVEYGSVWYGAFSHDLTLKNLTVAPRAFTKPVRVGRMEIGEEDGRREVVLTDISLDVSQPGLGRLSALFSSLGYAEVSAGARLEWKYLPADGRFDLDQFLVTVEDMGKLDVSLDLSNLRWPGGEFKLLSLLFLRSILDKSVLIGSSVGYEDFSLIRRLDEVQAKKLGVPLEKFREDRARATAAHAEPGMSPRAATDLAAFESFARDPRRIVIRLAPEKPVTVKEMSRIKDYGRWVDAMGVTVES